MGPRLRVFVFILACVCIMPTILFAQTDEEASARLPRLVIPTTVFDFGTINQGAKVEHTFSLRNDGEAPLKIEHVHASCGCMAAMLVSDTIAAGSEGSIRVTFDTTGFQGPKVKTVRFYSNDSRKPSVLLALKGSVLPEVRVSTPRLDFGSIRKGQVAEKDLNISLRSGSEVQLVEAASRSEHVEVIRGDAPKAGKETKLLVRLKSTLPVGIFRDRVVVKTNSRTQPVVNVAVFANVQGDLQAEPSSVSFGLLEGRLASPASKVVRIANRGKQAVRIVGVESDSAAIHVEVVKAGEKTASGGAEVVVQVQPDVVGAFRARVKVKTNHADPEQQDLFIPVYGIVSRDRT